jgi:hypothetical protein
MMTQKQYIGILGLIIALHISSQTQAQYDQVVDVSIGNRWIYSRMSRTLDYELDSTVVTDVTRIKEVIGDTIINDQDCRIISITTVHDTSITFDTEFWRVDSERFYILGKPRCFYTQFFEATGIAYDSRVFQDSSWGAAMVGGSVRVSIINWWDVYRLKQKWQTHYDGVGPDFYEYTVSVDDIGPIEEYYNYENSGAGYEETKWDYLTGASLDGSPYGTPSPPLSLEAIPGNKKVTLIWSRNIEPDISRYRIYFGQSESQMDMVDSSMSACDTTKEIVDLLNNVTYYFRITAVDSALNESGFSVRVKAIPSSQTSISTSFIQSNHPQAESIDLYNNYPNPFNSETLIKYTLPRETAVKLVIYNVLGRMIAEFVHENQGAGLYEVTWDASNSTSGIYFYSLTVGDFIVTKKMILLK